MPLLLQHQSYYILGLKTYWPLLQLNLGMDKTANLSYNIWKFQLFPGLYPWSYQIYILIQV